MQPWYAAGGSVGSIVIFTEDITEQMRAEESLRESEARMLTHKLTKPLYEAMLIIFLSAGVALIVNFIRTDTIPLTESYTHETDAALEHEISVEIAKKMINEGTAVLVDARSSDDFTEKHISGALNLPDQEFDECIDNFLSTIHPETTIITYCDGAQCDLAKNLAEKLNLVGFNRAFYIKNGWSKWQENN